MTILDTPTPSTSATPASCGGDASVAEALRESTGAHLVQFYENDASLCDTVAAYLADACATGGGGVVVASEAHRHGIAARLRARGIDLDALVAKGRYVALDASQTLARLLVDGIPDAARFHALFQPLVHQTSLRGQRPCVRVYGEMVAILWEAGRRAAALALERLWNELRERCPMSLLCAYPVRVFDQDPDPAQFREVCAEHGHVLPTEVYTHFTTPQERLRYIADLQQKASALGSEARRRRELEDLLQRRESELAELLESSPDGVLEIDAEGRVRWANPSHRSLLGYTDGEWKDRPVTDFLVRREDFTESWGRLLQGLRVEDVPLDVRTPAGELKHLRIHRGSLRLVDKTLRMRWFLRAANGTP